MDRTCVKKGDGYCRDIDNVTENCEEDGETEYKTKQQYWFPNTFQKEKDLIMETPCKIDRFSNEIRMEFSKRTVEFDTSRLS